MYKLTLTNTLFKRSSFTRFPEFKKYNVNEDYEGYKYFYGQIEPVSDFSPNNISVWLDINNDLYLAEDHGNLILRYSCPFLDNKTVYSVIGINSPIKTIDKLLAYQDMNGLPQELIMIPQTVVAHIKHKDLEKLNVEEDTENFDYIYLVADKANLTSPDVAKFRRTINRFIRDYGDEVTIKEIDLTDKIEASKLVNALHTWKSGNVVSNNDKLSIEGVAIDRYLNKREQLAPHCLEVFVGDVMVGFSIYNYPPQKAYAIINHIKCNYSYTNVFDFVFFCIMSHLKMDGIIYANGEQDLGIEGLRDYKHKLGPVSYIKRYTIKPRTKS